MLTPSILAAFTPAEQAEIARKLAAGDVDLSKLRSATAAVKALDLYDTTHPLECYQPIALTRAGGPHQRDFHLAAATGRGAFGGNQSGKTQCGSMEVGFYFCDVYPLWYPQKLRQPRVNTGRIVVKDMPHSVSEVIDPALQKSIHPRYVRDRKTNNKGFLTKMISRTGARFDIVTHDMDTMALEGWQGHWAWFDEPPPRDKWVATLRGLVRWNGRWMVTCTPLSEPWMYDEIYTNPEYFVINIDIRDNPYLSEEAIQKFESSLTEEEKEARLHGKFMHLSGLTYKEFDPAIHVKPQQAIPSEWPRWCVCDPHDRKPFALIWFAVDPLQRIWIYDEWPSGWFHEMKSSDKSLRDYVHLIREKEMGQEIYRRIIDGRAGKAPLLVGTQSGAHQDSLIDAFQDLGLVFEPSYITMTTGITDPGHLRVKEMLRTSPVTDEPSLVITANCRNLIYAFQHNTWENSRTETGVVLERQSQFAKDFLDLVRYGLMDNPHWFDPLDEHSQNADRPIHWTERAQMEGQGYGTLTDW